MYECFDVRSAFKNTQYTNLLLFSKDDQGLIKPTFDQKLDVFLENKSQLFFLFFFFCFFLWIWIYPDPQKYFFFLKIFSFFEIFFLRMRLAFVIVAQVTKPMTVMRSAGQSRESVLGSNQILDY